MIADQTKQIEEAETIDILWVILIAVGLIVILLIIAKIAYACCQRAKGTESKEIEIMERWAVKRTGKIVSSKKKKQAGIQTIKYDPHAIVDVEDKVTEDDEDY